MNYLLDTCVLSEFTRRQPNTSVVRWVRDIDEGQLFLSVVTLGEIRRGIEKLPPSSRKSELSLWLNEELIGRFSSRIIPLDAEMMLVWGALTARLEQQGRPMSVFDALIAATALQRSFTLVTRNVSDFEYAGIQIINPWN